MIVITEWWMTKQLKQADQGVCPTVPYLLINRYQCIKASPQPGKHPHSKQTWRAEKVRAEADFVRESCGQSCGSSVLSFWRGRLVFLSVGCTSYSCRLAHASRPSKACVTQFSLWCSFHINSLRTWSTWSRAAADRFTDKEKTRLTRKWKLCGFVFWQTLILKHVQRRLVERTIIWTMAVLT